MEIPVGRNDVVLSRGYCLFRRFELAHVPQTRRKQTLKIEIARWLPFSHADFHYVWQGTTALVWCWDRTRVESGIGISSSAIRLIPESILHAPAEGSGVLLRKAMDGFIGQCWVEGRLTSEVWWPVFPGEGVWRRFCRANGHPFDEVPEYLAEEWIAEPWGSRTTAWALDVKTLELRVFGFLTSVILMVILFHVGALLHLKKAIRGLEAEIEVHSTAAEPVLSARSKAMNARFEAERLLHIFDAPSPQVYLTKVINILPSDSRLLEWRFNMDAVEFVVESPGVSVLSLVQSFEQERSFVDVVAVPGKRTGQFVVSARVR